MLTMEYISTGEKLKQVRNALGMRQKEFSALVNIQQPNLSDYENNKVEPENRTIEDILRRANVNPKWWESGEGDIIISGGIKQTGQGNIAGAHSFTSNVNTSNEELIRLKVKNEMLEKENENLRELIRNITKKD